MGWEGRAAPPRPLAPADERRLLNAAAAGEGHAVAALLERYEGRVFNVAFRITGERVASAEATREAFVQTLRALADAEEPATGAAPLLMGAACEASFVHVDDDAGGAAGARHERAAASARGPSAEHDDAEPLEGWEEAIRAANARLALPERQALALQGPGGLGYAEIAAVMTIDRESVADLIARARLALHDELRGDDLDGDGAASDDCRAASGLMAMRDDGELAHGSDDAEWLVDHLAACGDCRRALDAMQDARIAYAEWELAAVPPGLFSETMARAATLPVSAAAPINGREGGRTTGADALTTRLRPPEGTVLARLGAAPAALVAAVTGQGRPWAPRGAAGMAPDERRRRRRRDLLLAGGWTAVLLLAALAIASGGFFDSEESEADPPPLPMPTPSAERAERAERKPQRPKKRNPAQRVRRRVAQPDPPARPRPVIVTPQVAPRRERSVPPRRRATQPRREMADEPQTTAPAPTTPPTQTTPQQSPQPGTTVPAPAPPPPTTCVNPSGKLAPC